MFLSPQHFQQQERYLEWYNRQLFNIYAPGKAGFTSLGIDSEQLRAGKLFIREASGLFPDGTPFQTGSLTVHGSGQQPLWQDGLSGHSPE
ncbi:type VI secretion system baseplate subunit TssK [Endozoicomonas sp. GU-1]|nr:type VI secretion system baseplate subunit TssK [Endozoicomonas sp. GU-1]WBA83895.1 type VI secretion system baseplate subunit TssK [Endozoicomonas sp. GU-1]